MKEELRKITVNLPAHLLDGLLRDSGKGLTESLTEVLQRDRQRRAFEALRQLEGSGDLLLTYEELKALRD